jgi:uncharacterized protein (TIGR02147 family)
MPGQDVFSSRDYKDFIQSQLRAAGGADGARARGQQTELARVAGCQRSFFSQMLSGDLHLSREQAMELCRHWNFDEDESEYFLTLLDLARGGSAALKNHNEKKLKSLRSSRAKLSQSLRHRRELSAEDYTTYYSTWYWAAIHMGIAVPGLDSPPALAERLGLPTELVRSALNRLGRMGLLKLHHGKWIYGDADLHIRDDSPLNEINHAHWRTRAILDVQKRSADALHYTSVFAISRKDAEIIRNQLAAALLSAPKRVPDSVEENIYCLNLDFFTV